MCLSARFLPLPCILPCKQTCHRRNHKHMQSFVLAKLGLQVIAAGDILYGQAGPSSKKQSPCSRAGGWYRCNMKHPATDILVQCAARCLLTLPSLWRICKQAWFRTNGLLFPWCASLQCRSMCWNGIWMVSHRAFKRMHSPPECICACQTPFQKSVQNYHSRVNYHH